VKNRELWEQLFTEVDRHQVEWVKVAGHTGVELNERADQLAALSGTPTTGGERFGPSAALPDPITPWG